MFLLCLTGLEIPSEELVRMMLKTCGDVRPKTDVFAKFSSRK